MSLFRIFLVALLFSFSEVALAISYPTTTPVGEFTGGTFRTYFDNIFSSEVNCFDAGQVVGGFDSVGTPLCVIPVATGFNIPGSLTGDTLRFTGIDWVRNNLLYNDGTHIGIGNQTPNYILDVTGTANFTSIRMPTGAASGRVLISDSAGLASWSDLAPSVSASGIIGGTEHYVTKFGLGGSGLVLSQIFDTGTGVGIGTTSPGYLLDIAGTANFIGIRMPTGAGSGKILTSDSGGLASWSDSAPSVSSSGITGGTEHYVPKFGSGGNGLVLSNIFDDGSVIGIGTPIPTAGYKVDINGGDILVNSLRLGRGGAGILSNIAFGWGALGTNASATNSAALGYNSLGSLISGAGNIGLGYFAGSSLSSGSNNIFIGNSVEPTSANISDQLNIGNWIYGSGGNIGIGTSTPGELLTLVGGSIQIVDGNEGAGKILMSDGNGVGTWQPASAASNAWLLTGNAGTVSGTNFIGTTDAQDLRFRTNNTDKMIIGVGGDVGIGTSSPGAKLEVAGQVKITGGTPGAGKYLVSDSVGLASWTGVVIATSLNISGSTLGSTLYYDGTNWTPSVNIYNTGANVGIGTSSPGAKLEVAGTIKITGGTPGAGKMLISDAVGLASWQSTTTSLSGTYWALSGNTIGASDFLGSTNAQDLVFKSNNTEKLRIGSSATASGVIMTLTGGDALIRGMTLGRGAGGKANVVFGDLALASNTNGAFNVAIGTRALSDNSIGMNNVAVGVQALNANTAGESNVAMGRDVLIANTGGSNNTGIGYNALYGNTIGSGNTALGSLTLFANTTGNYNTALGYNASVSGVALTNATAIGANASVSASNSLVLGSGANVGIGTTSPGAKLEVAGQVKITGGTPGAGKFLVSDATGLATWESTTASLSGTYWALSGNIIGASDFLGSTNAQDLVFKTNNAEKMRISNADGDIFIDTMRVGHGASNDLDSVAVGRENGTTNVSGLYNTSVGSYALQNTGSGNRNSTFGWGALQGAVAGASDNIAIGAGAISNGSSSSYNTIMGTYAYYYGNASAAASDNTVVGYRAMHDNRAGAYNTIMGSRAGGSYTAPAVNYSNSTIIGYMAGDAMSTGSNNVLYGYKAGDALTSGSNNIVIGYNIDAPSATGSNTLTIGNLIFGTGVNGTNTTLSTGNVGIGTSSPGAKLEVAGTVKITGGTPGAGKMLISDAVGLASWQSTTTSLSGTYWALSGNTIGASDFLGSTNAQDLRFRANNTQRMVITSAGRVGIGISNPTSANLELSGSAIITGDLTVQGKVITDTIVNRTVNNVSISGSIMPDTAAPLAYRDIGSNTQRWNNLYLSGQVTIGGGTPGAGKILTSDANGLASWSYGFSGTTTASGITGGASGYLSVFGAGGNGLYSSRLFQTGTYIGIGTAVPGYTLDVSGTGSFSGFRMPTGAGNRYILTSDATGNASWSYGFSGTTTASGITGGASGYLSVFGAGGNGLYSSRLFQTGTYIGIGTAVPGYTLDVSGTGSFSGFRMPTGAGNGLVFTSDASGNASWVAGFSGTTTASGITGGTQNYIPKFGTGGVGLYLSQIYDDGTNVGIGSTGATSKFEIWYSSTVPLMHFRGTNNVGIGSGSVRTALTGNANSGFGHESLFTLTTGYSNTAAGYRAMRQTAGGFNNSAFGQEALYNNNGGSWNSALGYQALYSNQSGTGNVALGGQSLYNLSTGNQNVAIGFGALRAVAGSAVSSNVAIGSNALYSTTSSNQVAIGHDALTLNSSGTGNTALGYQSLDVVTTTSNNTGLGYNTLSLTTGANNTAIGANAGSTLTTGSNNIIIGSNKQATTATASNQLNIGDWIYGNGGNIGIGTGVAAALTSKLNVDSGTNGISGLRFSRITSTSTVTSTDIVGLGVNGSGEVVPISNGDVIVYDGVTSYTPSPDPNNATRVVSYDYNKYFAIPAKQSFVVTDGLNPGQNAPYIGQNAASSVCEWTGTYGTGMATCPTSDSPGSPYNSFTMSARSDAGYGYQIGLAYRGDVPLMARSGQFRDGPDAGTNVNFDDYHRGLYVGSTNVPAPWYKVFTVPTNHIEWFYLDTGYTGRFAATGKAGMIGIGTTDPNYGVDIRSTVGMMNRVYLTGTTAVAASPTLSFEGDTNMGIFRPAADTLALSTNGTEALRIFSNGNVSIGSTTNSAKLRVDGQVMITGGTPGAGKVLTSTDATGIATWEAPSGGGGSVTVQTGAVYTYVTTAAQSRAASSLADLTDLTSDSLPVGRYKFSSFLKFRSAGTTTGLGLTLAANTATVTDFLAKYQAQLTTTADFAGSIVTAGTASISTGVPAANTDYVAMMNGTFNVTATGSVKMRYRSETTTSVTVQAGSTLIIEYLE